jgi:hypothetical protein
MLWTKIQSIMLYFRPSFVPLTFSLVHPHPLPCVEVLDNDSDLLGGGRGLRGLSHVDHILQEYNTLYVYDQIQNLQNC